MLSVRPRELRLVIQHHEAAMTTISCSSFIVLSFICAPTSSSDAKEDFYSQLDEAIKHIPKKEALILLGDFSVRVGHFGVDKCNENERRLLELCTFHHLCITNTVKMRHRFSWMHPRSRR